MTFKIVLLSFLLLGSITLIGQQKFEVEKPIKHKEVPEKAKQYVCELLPEGRIKWIYEITNGENTYEAKVRNKGEKYSIEFFTSGEFGDVEKEIEREDINRGALKLIEERLEADFDKFRMSKIQHHYSGDGKEVMKLLKSQEAKLSFINQRFEIEVKGLKNKELQYYQYVFTLEGDFVERLEIVENTTDNLLY